MLDTVKTMGSLIEIYNKEDPEKKELSPEATEELMMISDQIIFTPAEEVEFKKIRALAESVSAKKVLELTLRQFIRASSKFYVRTAIRLLVPLICSKIES